MKLSRAYNIFRLLIKYLKITIGRKSMYIDIFICTYIYTARVKKKIKIKTMYDKICGNKIQNQQVEYCAISKMNIRLSNNYKVVVNNNMNTGNYINYKL